MNFSFENEAIMRKELSVEKKLEDNLSEDIHSFIDKHMKERRNVRDSYLYDDSTVIK